MMDPDYDLFMAAIEAGSLSAAGRRLNISPAMMSKRLTRLENRLGVHLLHRTTRRLTLTVRGEELHSALAKVFADLKKAEAYVRGEPGQPTGPLRMSAPTSFGRMHLAPYIGKFLRKNPAIDLTLDFSDEFLDLRNSAFDLAIRITARLPEPLVAHRLATSERIICASPAYLREFGEPQHIADLQGHRLLAAMGQLPWRLEGKNGEVAVTGTSYVATNSSELIRELTVTGAGIALRSLWDVNDKILNGQLVRILPNYGGTQESAIYAVHLPAQKANPALSAMITFLRGLYQPRPPWKAKKGEQN